MTETESRHARNAIDIIMEDHREVEQLFQKAANSSNPKEFHATVASVIAELVRHSVAEEQYLYPAVREYLANGDEVADAEIAEHAQAEQVMKEIEQMDAGDPQLRDRFNTLVEDVTHHVQEEESEALPQLREACPEGELIELGTKIERAKKMAPTRPHPSAPDTPPLNKLLAPGAGLVDRVRDALSSRPS